MDVETFAAQLEADQANRDFMNEWINGATPLDDPYVTALRYYRECAEKTFYRLIDSQISAISPLEGKIIEDHLNTPHWPGYLVGCGACEQMMQEAWEHEYDNRERISAWVREI